MRAFVVDQSPVFPSRVLSLLTGVTGSKALKMVPIGYIDPSFGSLVFQVIAATILGGILTIRLWWGRVTEKIGGLFGQRREGE